MVEANVRGQVPQKQGLKHHTDALMSLIIISPRASSTKTRIETTTGCMSRRLSLRVRGQVPQKQGLKLHHLVLLQVDRPSPRASSTKTRIETHQESRRHRPQRSPRASSTKTRIETLEQVRKARSQVTVRGQVPQKQGLKHPLCPELQIGM